MTWLLVALLVLLALLGAPLVAGTWQIGGIMHYAEASTWILFTQPLGFVVAVIGLMAILEMAPFDTARWVSGPDAAMNAFTGFNKANLAKDRDGHAVFLARSAWDVGYQQEKNPELVFSATKER